MKAVNKILNILVIVFGLASLVFFFTDFANIAIGEAKEGLVGAQLAFGSKVKIGATEYDMAKSTHILICFWLTAIAFLLSVFSFKSKKLRYAVPVMGIIDAVYMFVITFGSPWKFIDFRPISIGDISSMKFTSMVLFAAISIAVFAVLSVAYLLLDDYLEALASKGEKLTIPKRIVRFFRDYKGEVKKIVWPGIKDVLKNTLIVLIMCLLVGALIWLIDFGLGQLLNLVWGA